MSRPFRPLLVLTAGLAVLATTGVTAPALAAPRPAPRLAPAAAPAATPASALGETRLFFHSANGGYAQDSAADPTGAANLTAPAGSTLSTAPPTKATAATATYAGGLLEGDPNLPTFSVPVGGVVNAVCLDLYVATDSGRVDNQIDTRTSFYTAGGTSTADTVLTSAPYSSGILHLRGLVTPPAPTAGAAPSVTVEAGGAFTVATYVNTNAGYTLSYDTPAMASSITLNPVSCVKLPGSGPSDTTVAPAAAPSGLGFTATVPADIQRSESEPNMEIDQAGKIYTCGPTGFTNADDYAQVSTDGGDQFHLLGTPPRGQQGSGGGGDCGLATSAFKNSAGDYQYSYTGLGPLTGFTTSTSPDGGHTLTTAGPDGNGSSGLGLLTDRQWQVFTDPTTVLLSYNQQQPRNVAVQKSTDGGLTYGPNGVVAAPSPLFPGPMRILTKEQNPAANGKALVYFAWNNSSNGVNVSISPDAGSTWTDCRVAVAKGAPSGGFMTMDNDTAGNLYIAWNDKGNYQTYVSTLTNDKILGCNNPAGTVATPGTQPTNNPGWSVPVAVNGPTAATSLFPWLVAGGAPGRVAVAFYGTPSTGDPNVGTFKATWDVYVAQSLTGLAGSAAAYDVVKATTHPLHYDSICLLGLGCTTAMPAGDRSLGDFFALDYSPTTKALSIVYDQSSKKPGEASGRLATTAVVTQNAGPSNAGPAFDLPGTAVRPALRQISTDPTGDALSSYSQLLVNPGTKNEPGSDVTKVVVGPQVDLPTGAQVANGGFTVTMSLADLSTAALQKVATDTGSASLLYSFRFVNGFTASTATAYYSVAQGTWTFGYNDYTTGTCGGGTCQQYPGTSPVQGKVDVAKKTVQLSVPRSFLRALSGPVGDQQRPTEIPATLGSRFYDGAVFTTGNTQATQTNQSYLYPLDNSPAMDFQLVDAAPVDVTPVDPTPALPEVPLPALLAVAGAVVGALVLRRRRTRSA